MTPARFSECLLHIRWTPINIASALQCELLWIEAMEAGNEEVSAGLAAWLETLAQAHEALPPPTTTVPDRNIAPLLQFDIQDTRGDCQEFCV
ncbi:hypothetical protein J2046_006546 [Rhizobium petrolearium]|uniref:hypothetical protein n=1 Tax=Neorhizobium petrolearium TaxID=515361 RepID=UPI001F48FBA7|nr:hypothetical protein [Neorhizobium petrolearium]MBP1848256.1 hypothetical protein [Neorhizobium petrolearium]